MAGNWLAGHFKNNAPIILELACGDADYTLGLAKRYPEYNYIGIDIKGNRMWKGATRALESNLSNVAFLRGRIECIENFFAPGEISGIWITFPDPFKKRGKENRRLTSPFFLSKFNKLLKPEARLNLKTDDESLFGYTLHAACQAKWKLAGAFFDIYALPALPHPDLDLKTKYEKMHLEAGRQIKFIQLYR